MVFKIIELVGTSAISWEDAFRSTVREASQSLRHIRAVDVIKHSANIDELGEICEYRVTLHITFGVEQHSHLIGASTTSSHARV